MRAVKAFSSPTAVGRVSSSQGIKSLGNNGILLLSIVARRIQIDDGSQRDGYIESAWRGLCQNAH